MAIFGTKANNLTALAGSIPDTQLIIVPDPLTGELLRTTFGQVKSDIIIEIGDLSYLDDIIEVPTIAALPNPGAIKKIYVITTGADANKQFRWGGSIYIEFPQGSGDVAGEAVIRGNADTTLQANINAETAARVAADSVLNVNITAEATARANADTTLQGKINAEANTRSTNDNILQGLINSEGTIRANAVTDLQGKIDLKLNIADYNPNFKGKYLTYAALVAANPTGTPGNYAQVDAGAGHNVVNYNWDDEDGWVIGSSIGPTLASTDDLVEGSTNLYFTAARAQAAFSGTANRISITAGVIDISASYIGQNTITTLGTIGTGTWNATAIGPTYGGTGLTSYAKGDIIYASAVNTLEKLAAGTDGYVLTLVSGLPVWAAGGGSTVWTLSGSDIYYNAGSVAIGNTSVDSKAILDLVSNTKGFLPPRMTSTQRDAITSPPAGLVIYNTTNSVLNYYNGTAWGTSSPTQWTTNGSDIYYTTGKVGIGTSTPTTTLSVKTPATNSAIVTAARFYNPGSGGNTGAAITLGYADSDTSGVRLEGYYGASLDTFNIKVANVIQYQIAGATHNIGTSSSFIYFKNYITLTSGSGIWRINPSTNYLSLSGYLGTDFFWKGGYSTGVSNDFQSAAGVTTDVIIRARAFSGQTVDIQQWVDSSNAVLAAIGKTGEMSIGGTADSNALLTLSSTIKGFLPSRMSTTQKNAIASPTEGLIVYDNALHKLSYYNGTSWTNV